MKLKWNKSGDWRAATCEAPTYHEESGLFLVCGSWTTEGDNVRGWRKARTYELYVRGSLRDAGSLVRMKAVAQKIADQSKEVRP